MHSLPKLLKISFFTLNLVLLASLIYIAYALSGENKKIVDQYTKYQVVSFGKAFNKTWETIGDIHRHILDTDIKTFNVNSDLLNLRRFQTETYRFDSFFKLNINTRELRLERDINAFNKTSLFNFLRDNKNTKLSAPKIITLANTDYIIFYKSSELDSNLIIGHILALDNDFSDFVSNQTNSNVRIYTPSSVRPFKNTIPDTATSLDIPLPINGDIEAKYWPDINVSTNSKIPTEFIVPLLIACVLVLIIYIFTKNFKRKQLELDAHAAESINDLINAIEKFDKKFAELIKPHFTKAKAELVEQLRIAERKAAAKESIIEKLTDRYNEATQALEDVEEAPKVTSHFLSRMGEEVTTPMKTLSSMLQLLSEYSFDDEPKELINIARRASNSLINNLNNILDFSKLDAGVLKLNRTSFDIREMVQNTLHEFMPHAQQKYLELTSEYSSDLPDKIYNDQQRTKQILKNLLGNAIRFTKQGSVIVTCYIETKHKERKLKILVKDTGIGIPIEAQDKLFNSLELRTRLSNSSFTGRLRLIVSNGLAQLMGGAVGVKSTPGEGSTFWFSIDIDQNK